MLSALGVMTLALAAQPVVAQSEFKANIYGFVDVRSYFDTRKSATGACDYLYLYPLDESIDAGGNDLNELASSSQFGSTARFGLNLTGPRVLGAASRANVEMDFFNFSSTTFYLFRHAYMALDWGESAVTFGQTWHPMSTLMPSTVSIALGSPFNGLSRSSQLRYDYKVPAVPGLKLSTAAVFQFLANSTGPQGRSNVYQRNSMLPELYAGVEWADDELMLGTGIEWQNVSPVVVGGDKQYVSSFAGMAQLRYKHDDLLFMAKAYLGGNMSQLGFCTGYAQVYGSDRRWTPLNACSSWMYVEYGQSFKAGIFGGWMRNIGSREDIDITKVYSVGGDIDRMSRIAPNIKYISGNTTFAAEFDMTTVRYGERKYNGQVAGKRWAINNRLLLTATYSFNL